jgi:tRNA (guanine-N7-)-methyltransferase
MRLRGRKPAREELERQNRLVVLEPQRWRGRWHEFFGNDRPIHLEIGMGKGKFISEMCRRHPEINFIGMDIYDELLWRCSEKIKAVRDGDAGAADNVALVRGNAEYLELMFDEGELERIYLNFSDPWPKKKHAKRRLTHPRFLLKYKRVLGPRGEIHFKTDSALLFEFSLNSFADAGIRLRNITLDLHRDGIRDDLVMTEYETRFVGLGQPIYRLEAVVGEEALRAHQEETERRLAEALKRGGAKEPPPQAD